MKLGLNKYGLLLVMVLLAIAPQQAKAQNQDLTSTELWTGFTFKQNLRRNFQWSLEHQMRYTSLNQDLKSNFLEAGLKYKLTSKLSVKGKYRYTFRNDRHNLNRISLDLTYKSKLSSSNFNVRGRLRFQNSSVNYTKQQITLLRAKIGVHYKFTKHIKPYTNYEVFYRLNDRNEVRVNRYAFGVQWEFNKNLELNLFYQLDQEKNVKEEERQNIAGVLLTYRL